MKYTLSKILWFGSWFRPPGNQNQTLENWTHGPVQSSAYGQNRTEGLVLGSANVALNLTEPDFDNSIYPSTTYGGAEATLMRTARSCRCYLFCCHSLIIHHYPLHGHWGQIQSIEVGCQSNWILIVKSHHVAQLPIWALLAEGLSADLPDKARWRREHGTSFRRCPVLWRPKLRIYWREMLKSKKIHTTEISDQCSFQQRLRGLRGCILHSLLVLEGMCWIIVLVRAPCARVLAQGYFRLALLFK